MTLPRYSNEPFPAYRYLPFQPDMPHPRNDPDGHSYNKEEDDLASFSEGDWPGCTPYLYGVDLFNHGYWWEAHEAWETVWLAAGRHSRCGLFVQGLIQIAGGQLKFFLGEKKGGTLLTQSGLDKLSVADGTFLGIELPPFRQQIEHSLREKQPALAISLQF